MYRMAHPLLETICQFLIELKTMMHCFHSETFTRRKSMHTSTLSCIVSSAASLMVGTYVK